MTIPTVKTYQLDLAMLDEVNNFVDNTNWYVCYHDISITKQGPVTHYETRIDNKGVLLDCDPKTDADGYIYARAIIRQGYGWNEESIKRRALPIYNLFKHINSTFLNNKFTLDGIPEEIAGSRHIFYDGENKVDLPNWGKDTGPNGKKDERHPTPVWTAYANGKSTKVRRSRGSMTGGNVGISNGAHRDWDQDYIPGQPELTDVFSMIVCINKSWKYTEGGEIVFHETIPPSEAVAVRSGRGYGIGRPTEIHGHIPGLVIVYPADAIHATLPRGKHENYNEFSKNVVFRIRRKP